MIVGLGRTQQLEIEQLAAIEGHPFEKTRFFGFDVRDFLYLDVKRRFFDVLFGDAFLVHFHAAVGVRMCLQSLENRRFKPF